MIKFVKHRASTQTENENGHYISLLIHTRDMLCQYTGFIINFIELMYIMNIMIRFHIPNAGATPCPHTYCRSYALSTYLLQELRLVHIPAAGATPGPHTCCRSYALSTYLLQELRLVHIPAAGATPCPHTCCRSYALSTYLLHELRLVHIFQQIYGTSQRPHLCWHNLALQLVSQRSWTTYHSILL